MTTLINLLSWQPGHSGFGSYVQRVVLSWMACACSWGDGQGQLVRQANGQLIPRLGHRRVPCGFLQRYSLVQHGLDLPALLQLHGLAADQLEGIYSPFFDALLLWPEVPQLITYRPHTLGGL